MTKDHASPSKPERQAGLDTGNLDPSDQYDAWCAALSDHFGTWIPDQAPEGAFFARTNSRSVGNTLFTECICDPCAAYRPNTARKSHLQDTLTFQLVLSGRENFEIGDNREVLSPGDLLIWSDLNPMRFEVVERLHKVSVTLPLSRLRNWMPVRWSALPSYHCKGSASASILTALMASTTNEAMNDQLRNGDAIGDALIGALVGVLGDDEVRAKDGMRNAHLLRLTTHVANNLKDPDLSPASVAAALKISPRHLHSLAKETGMTMQRYIIMQRLEKIRTDLGNPAMSFRTITDIAFSWGFRSSAHFSRKFREVFDSSPSEYRRRMMI